MRNTDKHGMAFVPVLRKYDLTPEMEASAFKGITPVQHAFFHNWYHECIFTKASLAYNPADPLEHVIQAAELDGKLQILRVILGQAMQEEAPEQEQPDLPFNSNQI